MSIDNSNKSSNNCTIINNSNNKNSSNTNNISNSKIQLMLCVR